MSALRTLYIDRTAADPAGALMSSEATGQGAQPPEFRASIETIDLILADGAGSVDAASGGGGYSVKFGIGAKNAQPTSGTFTLTDGTATTSALAFDVSASALQTALNALNSGNGPYNDTVTVRGVAKGNFLITWDTNGAVALMSADSDDNLLAPSSGISFQEVTAGDGSTREVQALQIQRNPIVYQESWTPVVSPKAGWRGQVNFNTWELKEELANNPSADVVIEVQIIEAASGDEIVNLQVPSTVHGTVINPSTITNVTLSSAYTKQESDGRYVWNQPARTGLTGGGSTKLDGIITAGSGDGVPTVGTIVAVVVSNEVYHYQLQAGTTAESSPAIIRPDDYATTTNEKIWVLLTISASGLNLFGVTTPATITAAGNTDIDIGSYDHLTALVTVSDTYDASPFTRTISLLTTNAAAGDIIQIRFTLPASTDPTIEVRNASSGGTLLSTINPENNTDVVPAHASYVYSGSAWLELAPPTFAE